MKPKFLFSLLLGGVILFPSKVRAEGYRLPFEAGEDVAVTQACILSDEPDCEHSLKFGNPYSFTQRHAIDFGCDSGESILAIQEGTVDLIQSPEQSFGYGNVIKLRHSDGRYSLYAHLQELPNLSVGDDITQGEAIGKCGETGNSPQGPHLHLELRDAASLDINRVSTVPILFDECIDNSECVNGQVKYPNVYRSINDGRPLHSDPQDPNDSVLNVPSVPVGESCEKIDSLLPTTHFSLLDGQIVTSNEDVFALQQGNILTLNNTRANYRDAPGGSLLGQIPGGCQGTYLQWGGNKPLGQVFYNWLKVDWGFGRVGYVAEELLVATIITVPQNNLLVPFTQSSSSGENDSAVDIQQESVEEAATVSEPSAILGLILWISSMVGIKVLKAQ